MVQKILLIDDDKVVNFINSKMVEAEFPGLPVLIFENGLQALKYIFGNSKTPFLVFLDINMPVMNAWELLEAISNRQEKFDLEIHILTSSINKSDQVRAHQFKQVCSFLHKPLRKKYLAAIKKEYPDLKNKF